ncbi:competence/damage-inducible protein A [Natronobacterium texcoconense]|uniref:Molybdenum cofactor synthesis domain-containing protein n=1 Tax=Natronobacterium texcoconense TaxID=1095778 RepID=A0A1H1FXD3_NATTX|nr:molybdopterin-binding protein [Natronobacterium texcoconense]SDR05206.1 molybdenum cofactor synthesis domain-containing protein [Natronobacterium texcoconense]
MEVAIITVGDELLSGDTVNTNGNWLATQLSDRGVTVTRLLSLPDDRDLVSNRVADYSASFDGVVVTGGIGGTPDDVTMDAVADAFDRGMAVTELALSDVERRLAEIQQKLPEHDLAVDAEAEAALPEGSRPLLNEAGLAPGCVIENVYVFPGIPEELEAMFGTVADEFDGERRSRFLYTVEPEANIVPTLEEAMDRFAVTVGCYPDREAGHNRLKVVGTDDGEVAAASDWLLETIDASETPVSREWGDGDDGDEPNYSNN